MTTILMEEKIQALLQQILENEKTLYKDSYFSKQDKKYGYNQYSMLIIIDFLIKYQIIIEDNKFFSYMYDQLRMITFQYQTHQELVISLHKLLGNLVKIKLQLKDMISKENKKEILQYIYSRYIVHGYCFHSFPAKYKKQIEENGIDPKMYEYPKEQMKKISYIFSNHQYNNMITKTHERSDSIIITDSPAMAYLYTFATPSYFANLAGMGSYYKDEKYDKEAFYRRDKKACNNNLSSLCDHVRLTKKEKETVMNSFDKQWNILKLSDQDAYIAYIKRSKIDKDRLLDIEKVYENLEKEPLEISIAKIVDSRLTKIRRYTLLPREIFDIHPVPTYNKIKTFKLETQEKPKEEKIHSKKKENTSYIDVLALLGVLLITLGMTLFILLYYLKGR